MAIYECHEVTLSETVSAPMDEGRGERLPLEMLGGLKLVEFGRDCLYPNGSWEERARAICG
jgi:hypothetical protein